MSDTSVSTRPVESDLRLVATLVYGLYLLAPFNGITALVGVVIAYVKRSDARGTIYESHFSNAIMVFWVSFVACILTMALILQTVFGMIALHDTGESMHEVIRSMPWLGPTIPGAMLLGAVFSVWLFYRVVRGLIHVLENKPY